MILKQTRVRVGGAGTLLAHITSPHRNEHVEILHGHPTLPLSGDIIARMNNRKYGNRHVIISPEFELDTEQLYFVLSLIFRELDPKNGATDNYLLIKHKKKRHDSEHDAAHYHLVLNETTHTGNQLDHRMSYLKNEKIARICELKFGHPVIRGRHNKAVVRQLRTDGFCTEVKFLVELTRGPPALAAFSSKQLRRADRMGIDLPQIYYQILRSTDADALQKTLFELSKMTGISFQITNTPQVLLLQHQGKTIINIFRFIKNMEIHNDYIKKYGTAQLRVSAYHNQNSGTNSRTNL